MPPQADEDLLQLHIGVSHDASANENIHNSCEHVQPSHQGQGRLQSGRLIGRSPSRGSIHGQANRPDHIRHLSARAMQNSREVQSRAQDRVLQRGSIPVVSLEQDLPLHCINALTTRSRCHKQYITNYYYYYYFPGLFFVVLAFFLSCLDLFRWIFILMDTIEICVYSFFSIC